jgi:hypothetical protein
MGFRVEKLGNGSMITSKARVAPESRLPEAVALETFSGLSTGDSYNEKRLYRHEARCNKAHVVL